MIKLIFSKQTFQITGMELAKAQSKDLKTYQNCQLNKLL